MARTYLVRCVVLKMDVMLYRTEPYGQRNFCVQTDNMKIHGIELCGKIINNNHYLCPRIQNIKNY